jgi:hypothetical protein
MNNILTHEALKSTLTAGGHKADTGKIPCELLAPSAMLGTAAVLDFGAKKYARENWRKGLAWSRVIGAILRHLFAFMAGEDLDKETGLPHIDHVACEVMFLQEFYRTRKDLDDRYSSQTNKE